MTREERVRFCRICQYRELDPRQGVLCALTHKKADFEGSCPYFLRDEQEEFQVVKSQLAAAGDGRSGDDVNFRINKIGGIVTFTIASLLTFVSLKFYDKTHILLIDFGLYVLGISQYLRGVHQEKIFREFVSKRQEEERAQYDYQNGERLNQFWCK
jgi:hypothetical protein